MKKTREQIEQIALERWPDDGFHGINQERREAFIEGYTLCQEEGNTANGAIPYESLSEGIKASIDSIGNPYRISQLFNRLELLY